jgi:hypothetical protein
MGRAACSKTDRLGMIAVLVLLSALELLLCPMTGQHQHDPGAYPFPRRRNWFSPNFYLQPRLPCITSFSSPATSVKLNKGKKQNKTIKQLASLLSQTDFFCLLILNRAIASVQEPSLEVNIDPSCPA